MAKKKDKEEKQETKGLSNAIANIEKEFGKGSIIYLGDAKIAKKIDTVSTGSISLDMALGVGGLPRGRVIEIFGPESGGKTTLALEIIAMVQRDGGKGAFVDAEHAFDPRYAKALGVDVKHLLLSQPDSGEQGLSITEQLVKSGDIDIVVIDSVAALTPQAELDGSMGDSHMGLQARLMGQALRKLTAIIGKTKTIVIFINQLRMKIGIMFGNPETTTGGNALKFYASVRLDIRKVSVLKQGENVIGNNVRVKVVKNKVAAPFREAEFTIIFGKGVDKERDVLSVALAKEVLTKSGASIVFEGERIGAGQDAAISFLQENPDIMEKIIAAIWKHVEDDTPVEEVQVAAEPSYPPPPPGPEQALSIQRESKGV